MTDKMKITLNQLADIFDKYNTGRKARTLPIEVVVDWAERRKDLFLIDEDGYILLKT